jgi:hypothetical protein
MQVGAAPRVPRRWRGTSGAYSHDCEMLKVPPRIACGEQITTLSGLKFLPSPTAAPDKLWTARRSSFPENRRQEKWLGGAPHNGAARAAPIP